jgi:hypothetical protein
MISSHRTPIVPIFLIIFATVAPYAHARPQVPSAQPAAPAAVATELAAPAATTGTATVSVSRSYATKPGVVLPSNSLLADMPTANSLTEPVLVIPGKPMDPQAIDQVVEDLSVMSRILEKNAFGEYYTLGGFGDVRVYDLYRVSTRNAAGPGLLFPTLGRAKPMYLGGYGAVFFIQVGYPLLPPPEAPKEQPAGQQEDSVWAEAKRSVFEPQARPALPQVESEAVEPYYREKVDEVRSALVVLMKHAGNIRVLEPAEWVAIVVQGPAASAVRDTQEAASTATGRPAVAPTAGKTVMTLRATKADVDLYAKGQFNQQQFEQRLQVVTY